MSKVIKKKSGRYSKNKGRVFQNYVRDRVRGLIPPDIRNDVQSAIMGESGVDIKLSEAVKKIFPFDIECKAVERLNLQEAYEQSVKNSEENRVPVVVHKRARKQALITLDFETFLSMVSMMNSMKVDLEKREQ